MEHIVAGRDVLVVLPTGSGKSAIYQVPTLLMNGSTVVVSPLIALQRDQVAGLGDTRAPGAVVVNSDQPQSAAEQAWQAVREGDAQYLFLSPEQLAKDEVVVRLVEVRPSLFVVDEAHCVSAWGHDFRPDYLRLGGVIERLGHPTVVALTATAASPIRADIIERLGLREPQEVIASFDRPNLHLNLERFTDDADKRRKLAERVAEQPKPGLVYVATRKDAESYAGELDARGVRAAAYHAGMNRADRQRVQQEFMDDTLEVLVATSAFGMGIDKPNVRFVFHASVPASLDSYYQEIGRAGRDDQPAEVVLFYRPEDLGLQKFLTSRKPPVEVLTEVARTLRSRDEPMTTKELKAELDLPPAKRTRALNLLEQAGAVATTAEGRLDYFDTELTEEQAAQRAVQVAQTHQQLDRSRLEMMRGYAETTGCRRQYLLGYFGEQLAQPCGHCDTCDSSTPPTSDEAVESALYPPNTPVRHTQWGSGVVLRTEQDRITVLFEHSGYKTLSLPAIQDNDVLTRTDQPDPDDPSSQTAARRPYRR